MSKYNYIVQCKATTDHKWFNLIEYHGMEFCKGYMFGVRDKGGSPRLDHRLIRSVGGKVDRVIDEITGSEEVSIGMIAGFPTAEQYERAAEKAMKKADDIRRHDKRY